MTRVIGIDAAGRHGWVAVTLDGASYREANERCEAMGRPKLSAQSWGIVPKIREARAWAGDLRVIEAHPEVSFTTMADGDRLPP